MTVAVRAVEMVVVVVPLVLSWATAEPAARTVRRMFESCILKEGCVGVCVWVGCELWVGIDRRIVASSVWVVVVFVKNERVLYKE